MFLHLFDAIELELAKPVIAHRAVVELYASSLLRQSRLHVFQSGSVFLCPFRQSRADELRAFVIAKWRGPFLAIRSSVILGGAAYNPGFVLLHPNNGDVLPNSIDARMPAAIAFVNDDVRPISIVIPIVELRLLENHSVRQLEKIT